MIYSTTKEDFKGFLSDSEFEKLVDVQTVAELFDHVKKYGSLPAIGKTVTDVATYDDFCGDVLAVCQFLKNNNVPRGSNVGVLCDNGYDFACTSFAIMAYGATAVLLPVQLDTQTVFGCSMKYSLSALFCDEHYTEKTSMVKVSVYNPLVAYATKVTEGVDGLIDRTLTGSSPACIIFTGGTTGKSKGALLPHTALTNGIISGCYGLKNVFNQVYYCIMPLTHVFGFIRNLLTSLYTGSVIFFNKDKRAMFGEIAQVKPTELVIVPALAELFLNLIKAYGPQMLGGRLQTVICGAANVPPYLIVEYDKLGIVFCPGYGLTELANMVSGNPYGMTYPDSVGKLFPGIEAKIVNGELWLRGRSLMTKYYGEDAENASAFEDGWFKTGDLARFDEQQNLYIIGRIKDVIVLPNGENVSPAHVESKINELDFIQDSLVYESKNQFGATVLVAEVTLRKAVLGAMKIAESDVNAFVTSAVMAVNEKLLDYERFAEVKIRENDFERSPAMKIIRPRKMY